VTTLYRFIARVAYDIGWESLSEWAARNYRAKTGKSALDDR
jgi:hypothetical protein